MTDVPDPPSSPPEPTVPWHAMALPDYAVEAAEAAPAGQPRRLSPRSALVVVGAVALLAASSFAVWALTRPDGADSPEAAVRSMFSAIDHEDALGVVESLPPGERKVLRDPLVDTNKELHRLGVLKSFSLDDVPGADLQVKDLKLATTDLGDGVTAVEVTGGTISGKSIPKDIPLGDPLKKIIEDNGGTVDFKESTFSEDLSQDHLKLVTIKEDGGWHVSLAYSVAEAIRTSAADDGGDPPPVPDFGHGVQPVGADSPDAAVHDLADAAVARDAAKAVALTDPQEMRALYDYAPLFLPKVARSTQQAEEDDQPVITVSKLDTSVEGDGTIRRVRITGFDMSVKDTSSSTHVTFDGRCYDVTSTSTYESFTYATGSISGDTSDPSNPSPPPTIPHSTPKTETHDEHHCAGDNATTDNASTSPFGTLGMFGSSTDEPFAITVTQVDGRWYVSPVRTVLDSLVEGLRRLQPSDIEKWGSWFKDTSSDSSSESFSSVGTAIGGSSPDDGSYPTATTIAGGNQSDAIFPGLAPAARQVVESECSTAYDAYQQAAGDPLHAPDHAYYQSIADLYRCASYHSVPGYAPCLPLLDEMVSLSDEGTDATFGRTLSEAQACVARVHG